MSSEILEVQLTLPRGWSKSFGLRVFVARLAKSLKGGSEIRPADVGREIGVSQEAARQWERSVDAPRMDAARADALCAYLGVRYEWLFLARGAMFEPMPSLAAIKATEGAAAPPKLKSPLAPMDRRPKEDAVRRRRKRS